MFDETGDLQTRSLYGQAVDELFASETATGEVFWALADHQGSVRDIATYDSLADTTTIANHIRYSSFGEVTSETDPATGTTPTDPDVRLANLRTSYTAREWDADAGLFYYRARWYDPRVGRFISEDPLSFAAGDVNLQRYVGNSPVLYVDPSGLISDESLAGTRDVQVAGAGPTGPYTWADSYSDPGMSYWDFFWPSNNQPCVDGLDATLAYGKWFAWITAAGAAAGAAGLGIAAATGVSAVGTMSVTQLAGAGASMVSAGASAAWASVTQLAAASANMASASVSALAAETAWTLNATYTVAVYAWLEYPPIVWGLIGTAGMLAQTGDPVFSVGVGFTMFDARMGTGFPGGLQGVTAPRAIAPTRLADAAAARASALEEQTIRVFTTTSGQVNLGRLGTGTTNAQTGTLTSPGAGGTFVTRTNLTDPKALQFHIDANVPPGLSPKFVTEIELPNEALRIDPTEIVPRPGNGWIPPNPIGARIVRVWEIRWVQDPRGFEYPTLVEVPVGGP